LEKGGGLMTSVVLRFDNVCRTFGELRAVDQISFDVTEGQIVGLIGPNGSGKTTLLNVASGLYESSSGHVFFNGRNIGKMKLHEIAHLGMARSFQNPRIFGSLDVMQHTVVALRKVTFGFSLRTIFNRFSAPWKDWTDDALTALKVVFGSNIPQVKASALPYGQRRLLELARCIATKPKLLLLDEPTSGLNDEETAALSVLLLKLVHDYALTALIVDHKFGFLRELCGRIVVMDHGRRIADGTPYEISQNEEVNAIYFGGIQ
jgi:branched-chain amino acid transport system ATP-binding protein